MSRPAAVPANIQNRSPWQVHVRSQPTLARQFSFPSLAKAQAYRDELAAQGYKPLLTQLETSFQLRIRRQGAKAQYITFDTWVEAEQTRSQMAANLSVSIVRDYAVATRTTLRELMERYLEKVVPTHKGAAVETNRLRRLMRDESFVAPLLPGKLSTGAASDRAMCARTPNRARIEPLSLENRFACPPNSSPTSYAVLLN